MQKSIAHLPDHALVIEGLHFLAAEQLERQQDAGQRRQKHGGGGLHIDIVAQLAELLSDAQEFREQQPALHDEGAVEERADFRIAAWPRKEVSQERDTAPVLIQNHAGENVQLVAQRFARHAQLRRLRGGGHQFQLAFEHGLQNILLD